MSAARRPKRPDERNPGDAGFDETRAVFMISVAAELAAMHPQTLRMYEARGLITPQRSPKNTRLYSYEDVERLRRIQRMTEQGLNLTGVETVLELERQMERMRSELSRMRERASELERSMLDEIESVRRSFRAEIVPYGAYEDALRREGGKRVRIPVQRDRGGDGKGGSSPGPA
ncbi:MAG TPA: helix-turn-helix transcriptional regulator [Solirubrobacterales bacterium]|nr:helix-turn-helix transcriptional regulator [Solirubrobacterales bacterium]